MTALSPTDVWAVGRFDVLAPGASLNPPGDGPGPPGVSYGLIEHWNGRDWTVVPSPAPRGQDGSTADAQLDGVVSIGANDVWAWGFRQDPPTSLFEHWDGRSWRIVPAPPYARFDAVGGTSSNDLWAVGSATVEVNHGHDITRIAHWNGQAWSLVRSPSYGTHDNELTAVASVSSDDAWAVGTAWNRALVEHWDGRRWSLVQVPRGGVVDGLSDVVASAKNDVWAVGTTFASRTGSAAAQPLVERWNGLRWARVPVPGPSRRSGLVAIATDGSAGPWALGFQGAVHPVPFIVRWDGTSWRSPVNQPPQGWHGSADIAVAAGGPVWIVTASSQPQHPVIQRCAS